jgi:hypothetical protein
MKYNIIANSIMTSSGISLSFDQLRSLHNGDVNSTSIPINTSEVLVVDSDYGYRTRINNFDCYISNQVGQANVLFSYKDEYQDQFVTLSGVYNGVYYQAVDLPDVFAPKVVRVHISDASGYVSEIVTNNEDYSVSFGEDGNQTVVDISDSESSNQSDTHILKIKNTSSVIAASAYVCVDYSGKESDYYVKLSSDNEVFFGVKDGLSITDDYDGSVYRWSYGVMDNIRVVDNSYIEIDDVTSGSGVYTTQIFSNSASYKTFGQMTKHDSSYVVSTCITESGSSVSSDNISESIEVRSSNVKPMDYNKIIYVNNVDYSTTTKFELYTYDMLTLHRELFSVIDTGHNPYYHMSMIYGSFVGPSGDMVFLTYDRYYHGTTYSIITTDIYGTYRNRINTYIIDKIEINSNVWALQSAKLLCYSIELAHDGYIEDVSDFSCDRKRGSSKVWVIYDGYPGVSLMDVDTVHDTVEVTSAKLVSANSDGGFWVFEDSTNSILKMERSHAEYVSAVSIKVEDVLFMENDGLDGLWYVAGSTVFHISNSGANISDTMLSFTIESISSSPLGLVAQNSSGVYVFIDNAGKVLVSEESNGAHRLTPVGITYDNALSIGFNALPITNDPMWSENGELQYNKIPVSGSFLPKTKYHQFRYILRPNNSTSPIVRDITIPKPIVINDIQLNGTKDIYIRTEFTGNDSPVEYTSKLKCWWHIQE